MERSADDSDWQPLGIEDFHLPFLILGAFCSIGLLVNLWELLISPDNFYIKKYKLVLCGLTGCLYVTCVNLSVFTISVVQNVGEMDLETEWSLGYAIDWEKAESRKEIAFAILGFGAVTSYLFIVACLVKCLGFPTTFHYNSR